MSVNIHQLLITFNLDLVFLNSRLNLLTGHPALICAVRHGVVPLAAFLILQLFSRCYVITSGDARTTATCLKKLFKIIELHQTTIEN